MKAGADGRAAGRGTPGISRCACFSCADDALSVAAPEVYPFAFRMYANSAAWSASEIVFDARGGIVVRTMKNRSSSVMRGSPQLVAKRGPVSDGALAPLSVAPWHDAHDWR